MIQLKKAFSFEAAHRLGKGYPGKCRNIHGHSWSGELLVTCTQLNQFDLGIDYGDIQVFLNQIEDELDHILMLDKGDQSIIDLCNAEGWDVKVFDQNPSSEVVAQYILDEATDYFNTHYPEISVHSVSLSETCQSNCTVINQTVT